MQLVFKYEQGEDIKNYLILSKIENKGGRSEMLESFFNVYGNNLNEKNLRSFINSFIKEKGIDLKKEIKRIENSWQAIQLEFQNKMTLFFNRALSDKVITVYLTTNDRCLYSVEKNCFFVTATTKSPKRIIMHELVHFYTTYAFEKELLSMKDKKIAYAIKESLTEILNLEFSHLLDEEEKGYPQHQEMRRLIRSEWQKEKNIEKVFKKLLDFKS